MQLALTATSVAVRHEVFTTEEEGTLAGFLGWIQRLDSRGIPVGSPPVRRVVRRTRGSRCSVPVAPISKASVAISKRWDVQDATIARRLCTIACFYGYAEEEGLLAARRPCTSGVRARLRVTRTGLDRNEVGAMLVAAGLAGARDHVLVSLLALSGLRVSEATGADIEQLGLERGHRTLRILRKDAKLVTIPLAPRTAGRSIRGR